MEKWVLGAPTAFYHSTTLKALESIKRMGLVPKLDADAVLDETAVFLSSSPKGAARYTDIPFLAHMPGAEPMVCLKVTLPKGWIVYEDPGGDPYKEDSWYSKERIPSKLIQVYRVLRLE